MSRVRLVPETVEDGHACSFITAAEARQLASYRNRRRTLTNDEEEVDQLIRDRAVFGSSSETHTDYFSLLRFVRFAGGAEPARYAPKTDESCRYQETDLAVTEQRLIAKLRSRGFVVTPKSEYLDRAEEWTHYVVISWQGIDKPGYDLLKSKI